MTNVEVTSRTCVEKNSDRKGLYLLTSFSGCPVVGFSRETEPAGETCKCLFMTDNWLKQEENKSSLHYVLHRGRPQLDTHPPRGGLSALLCLPVQMLVSTGSRSHRQTHAEVMFLSGCPLAQLR